MSHANMRFRIIVHEKAGFEQWVAAQQRPAVIVCSLVAIADGLSQAPVSLTASRR